MNRLIKIECCNDIFSSIANTYFLASAGEHLNNYVERYENNEVELWCMEPMGLLLLEFIQYVNGSKYMIVHLVCGVNVLTVENMSYLHALAVNENCILIQCYAINKYVSRLHYKLGFHKITESDGRILMEKTV